MNKQEYAGFWIRTGAAIIDSLLMSIIVYPALSAILGKYQSINGSTGNSSWSLMFSCILPPIVIIVFWFYRSATPGKMVTRLEIVDAKTGEKPPNLQFIGRYLGYYLSAIPLFLGIFWVGIDKRKQGWHDKLAGTVVIKKDRTTPDKIKP